MCHGKNTATKVLALDKRDVGEIQIEKLIANDGPCGDYDPRATGSELARCDFILVRNQLDHALIHGVTHKVTALDGGE
jgi:hypothetical protein